MTLDGVVTVDAVQALAGASIDSIERLSGGNESAVYRLMGPDLDAVLHVLPARIGVERLRWVHALMAHVRQAVPEVVTPLQVAGDTFARIDGRMVVLSPFVAGGPLDRDAADMRVSAARLLAQIHASTVRWTGNPSSPPLDWPAAAPRPAELHDEALDVWWADACPRLVTAPVHGDFYRANLICDESRVVGIVDWFDARVQPLLLELAGAVFEMCRDADHVLDVGRAREFVAAYRTAGGPIPGAELGDLLLAIRVWVRNDALTSIAYCGDVTPYARNQIRAFNALRTCTLDELT